MKEITITVEGIKYETIYSYKDSAAKDILAYFRYNGFLYRVADDCAAMKELKKRVNNA